MGARQSNANYQFTLKGDDIAELKSWTTKLADAMQLQPQLTDISTDQEDRGVEMFVTIDHDAAARHGISSRDIDNALYNALSMRSEEHTSELQSLMRTSYAVSCLKKKNHTSLQHTTTQSPPPPKPPTTPTSQHPH